MKRRNTFYGWYNDIIERRLMPSKDDAEVLESRKMKL